MLRSRLLSFTHTGETHMDRGNLSRRGFLQRSLAALAATGLPAWYARDLLAADEKAGQKPAAANDRIVMGAIGIGSPASRGRDIAHDALNTKKGVVYVAVCDVDKRHRERAAREFQDKNMSVEQYHDFRQLLDRKDSEAVTIAVPDHWHALIAIDALRKGKDVYCEKPLTLTIAEGRALVKVAKETGRVFQVGTQQRSDGRFRLACELVRNGRLGKIVRVETRIGANPTSPELPEVSVPEGLDWNFWLGPAPEAKYVEKTVERKFGNRVNKFTYTRCPYEFRWWYEYSGGKMTDWGAHHNDIAQWGLGMDGNGPVAVEAIGKAPEPGKNRYNIHPEFKVTYTYATGTKLICAHTQLDGAVDPRSTAIKGRNGRERQVRHDNGILFLGEDGKWIFVNREIITASDDKLIKEPLPAGATRLYHSNNHMGNFLECLRNRKPTICPAEVGHSSVTVCHIGVIALRTGKKLKWDPARERFDDDEANKWLSREMREPWKLDV
jgi:predicted dehydrogenase